VVQLSINALKPPEYHFDLGTRLAGLRRNGVMILSSGNVVHNLGCIDWKDPDGGADWARRFDDAVAECMASDPGGILRMAEHPDYARAVPTPDHFLPLLYTAGLAAAGEGADALVRGYAMGSLSMTCYGVGVKQSDCMDGNGAAALPQGMPADQTNL